MEKKNKIIAIWDEDRGWVYSCDNCKKTISSDSKGYNKVVLVRKGEKYQVAKAQVAIDNSSDECVIWLVCPFCYQELGEIERV